MKASKIVENLLQEGLSLDGWYNKYPSVPVGQFVPSPNSSSKQAYVIPDSGMTDDQRRELWQLNDWRVSSVIGGAIWLIPMKKFEPFR